MQVLNFNMLKINVIDFIDKLAYISFMCLGCYFIYKGDVIPRYQMKRSNFAEYSVPMEELPVAYIYLQYEHETWLSGKPFLEYGKDFNISYKHCGANCMWTNLTKGQNSISGQKVHLEEPPLKDKANQNFRIFPSYNNHDEYSLKLLFSGNNWQNVSWGLVGFSLSTANNSYYGDSWRHREAHISSITTKLGNLIVAKVMPKKYQFIRDLEPCRDKPYYELESRSILKQIKENCDQPCRTEYYEWYTSHNGLPICTTLKDKQCFTDAIEFAQKNIIKKPCTKLVYSLHYTKFSRPANTAHLLVLTESRVVVKEEYLIYDLLAVVSSIGGVMGLCTGFSFANVTSTFLGWGKRVYNSIKDKVEDDSNFLRTENFQRDFQPKVEEMVKTIAKLESQIAKYEMRFIALERKQH